MTTRQCIIAALQRRQADRVPVSLYEMSGLSLGGWYLDEPSCRPLLEAQRQLGDDIVLTDVNVLQWMSDPNSIHDKSEMVGAGTVSTQTLRTPRGELTAVYRKDPDVATTWQLKAFVESADDARTFLSMPPEPHQVDVSALKRQIAHAGDDAFVVISLGDALGYVVSLFHYDRFAMLLMDEEDLVMEMMRSTHQRLRDGVRQVCSQVKGVGFRFWGPEYAGPSLLHPRYFRKLVVEFLAELVAMVRQSGNYAIVHAHGKLAAILDMIPEIGPHALEPLEVLPASTADVSMAQIKQRLGGQVALMGGIQCNELDNQSPQYIRERVREIMTAAKTGGGYIMIPTGTPIQLPVSAKIAANYRAYFQAAREFGAY